MTFTNYKNYQYEQGTKYPSIGGRILKYIDTSSDLVNYETKQRGNFLINKNNVLPQNSKNIKDLYKIYRMGRWTLYYDEFYKRLNMIFRLWVQETTFDSQTDLIDMFLIDINDILLNLRLDSNNDNTIYGRENTLTGNDWIYVEKRQELTANVLEYLYNITLRRDNNNNIRTYSNISKFLDSEDLTKNFNNHVYTSKEHFIRKKKLDDNRFASKQTLDIFFN